LPPPSLHATAPPVLRATTYLQRAASEAAKAKGIAERAKALAEQAVASIEDRLAAARLAAEAGIKVGPPSCLCACLAT